MKIFKVGDKAQIIDVTEKGRHLLNKQVTVIQEEGFGIEIDDVCVRTDSGSVLRLKEHQLAKI